MMTSTVDVILRHILGLVQPFYQTRQNKKMLFFKDVFPSTRHIHCLYFFYESSSKTA